VTRRSAIEELVVEGKRDWLHTPWIESVASEALNGAAVDTRPLALGLVAEALFRELMIAGSISNEGTFLPWDKNPRDSFELVITRWLGGHGGELDPGAIAWFENTGWATNSPTECSLERPMNSPTQFRRHLGLSSQR
jgi:hypothetical protein